jgi:hypothetical protein
MHLTVPVAILGFSSLSMTAPSEGLNGRSDGDEIRGPSDWAGSSLDDNHQLNMKSRTSPFPPNMATNILTVQTMCQLCNATTITRQLMLGLAKRRSGNFATVGSVAH